MPLFIPTLPNASADAVAILDQNFNQVFVGAEPILGDINERINIMRHPVESGAEITDFYIVEPVEIQFSLVITGAAYGSVYEQIKQLANAGTLLIVQTKTSSYSNMLIEEYPQKLDPRMYDAIALRLRLREARFVTPQYGKLPPQKVRNANQQDTVATGQKYGPKQIYGPAQQQTQAYQIFSGPVAAPKPGEVKSLF